MKRLSEYCNNNVKENESHKPFSLRNKNLWLQVWYIMRERSGR